MARLGWSRLGVGLLTCCMLAGCGGADDLGEDLEIPQLSRAEAPPVGKAEAEPASEIQQVSAQGTPREGNLALTLKQGDMFALRKTISQSLAQRMKDGPVRSTSLLSLTAGITVEKEEDNKRLLRVKYQRVRYSHDLMGDKVEYDSLENGSVPDAALLYQGMINNGFAFWLTHDNQIADIVDFRNFLQRCVQKAPANKQKQLIAQITNNTEDEGFANFVDDSIGLLRFNLETPGRETTVKEGDEWTRTRKFLHPLPMAINTTYSLTQLTDQRAEIDIFGTIVPARVAAAGPALQKPSDSEIILKDGHTSGHCTVDRATGLPTRSQVTRNLALRVRMPYKSEFDQHKQIVTTVDIYPTSGKIYIDANAAPLNEDRGVVPASAEVPEGKVGTKAVTAPEAEPGQESQPRPRVSTNQTPSARRPAFNAPLPERTEPESRARP